MKIVTISIAAMAIAISGCSNFRELQQIPVTTYNPSEKIIETAQKNNPNISKDEIGKLTKIGQAGALYVWPPYASASIVDGKGNRCVLVASGAKSINATSDATLKLAKALEKIEGLEAGLKNTLAETFTKLSAADEHAAFADVALFHLCMLDQNGTFQYVDDNGKLKGKSAAMMDAYKATIEAAKSLGK